MDSRQRSKSYLSKSRFKLATECPSKPYFSVRPEYGNKKDDNDFLRALAKGGYQVGALARWYVPDGTLIETLDVEDAVRETEALLAQEDAVIYEAAIRHEHLLIRADILVKRGTHIQLYEVKAKSFDGSSDEFYRAEKNRTEFKFLQSAWEPYFYDVAFQDYVVRKALPHLSLSSFLYLVDKSKRATVEKLHQKFLIRDEKGRTAIVPEAGLKREDLGDPVLAAVDITDDVARIQRDPEFQEFEGRTCSFAEYVQEMAARHAASTPSTPKASRECRDCEFRLVSENDRRLGKSGFDECWSQILPTKQPPKEALSFDLWRVDYRQADRFLEQGLYLMSQIAEADIQAPKKPSPREKYADGWQDFERRRLQLRKTNTGDPTREVLADKLRAVIETWRYPLHFIDFETTRVAIPFHRDMRPYEQIAFQFSHHEVDAGGDVRHKSDWLNTERGKFPNFDFLRALKRDLEQDGGTIFRYATHENTVLCEIIRQLEISNEPDKEALITWTKTITTDGPREMVDLLEVVKRYYYHPRMGRSNSIKAVLPAILSDSKFLQEKYSAPIYGAPHGIPSRNFTELSWNRTWVTRDARNEVVDPYAILKNLCGPIGGYDYEKLERLYETDEIADGGAAMTAYAMMQFTQMPAPERAALTQSLLRYCELDTLAMAMLYEHWCEIVGLKNRLRTTPTTV